MKLHKTEEHSLALSTFMILFCWLNTLHHLIYSSSNNLFPITLWPNAKWFGLSPVKPVGLFYSTIDDSMSFLHNSVYKLVSSRKFLWLLLNIIYFLFSYPSVVWWKLGRNISEKYGIILFSFIFSWMFLISLNWMSHCRHLNFFIFFSCCEISRFIHWVYSLLIEFVIFLCLSPKEIYSLNQIIWIFITGNKNPTIKK